MIKQNIFIVNFNSLYEILNEIKDKLSLISSRISYNELKFIINTFCLIIFDNNYDNSCKK